MDVPIFFKPTKTHREYHLYDMIEKNHATTQRQLSEALGTAVSMIHGELEEYEQQGFIKKSYLSSTRVHYSLTSKGTERKRYLSLVYYSAAQKIFDHAKDDLAKYLRSLYDRGFKKIFLYGAGEVAALIVSVIRSDNLRLQVLGILDDDTLKHGHKIEGYTIVSPEKLQLDAFDGVLVASFIYNQQLYQRLIDYQCPEFKILRYFTV